MESCIGIVWINDHRIDAASPWGGFKDSGIGSKKGIEAFPCLYPTAEPDHQHISR